MKPLQYRARLRVFREGTSFGPGTAELMEHIEQTESLSESCAMMGMAYSKGWKIMKRAEEDLGIKLMISSRGGKNGGMTALTEDGRQVLYAYRAMERDMQKCMDESFHKYFQDAMFH